MVFTNNNYRGFFLKLNKVTRRKFMFGFIKKVLFGERTATEIKAEEKRQPAVTPQAEPAGKPAAKPTAARKPRAKKPAATKSTAAKKPAAAKATAGKKRGRKPKASS